jgi:hypothetical protein
LPIEKSNMRRKFGATHAAVAPRDLDVFAGNAKRFMSSRMFITSLSLNLYAEAAAMASPDALRFDSRR